MSQPPPSLAPPTCADCFFRRNALCALPGERACPTFRPAGPEGLRPPRQMRLAVDPRLVPGRVVAFPTAAEQAARHAA